MITYNSGGRLGNRLFQYTVARLLAENLGYALSPQYSYNATLTPTHLVPGEVYENDEVFIRETAGMDCLFDMKFEKRKYRLSGYWQDSKYYLPNRDRVVEFFNEKATTETNQNDIVMHVRLDDYKQFGKGGTVLHPSYYKDALANETFECLHVVTDAPYDEYFSALREHAPIFHLGDEKEDFWFMTKFSRIICGNSTFSWWAAFLSNADKIYVPECWIRNSYDIDHRLDDITNGRCKGIKVPAGFLDYGGNGGN